MKACKSSSYDAIAAGERLSRGVLNAAVCEVISGSAALNELTARSVRCAVERSLGLPSGTLDRRNAEVKELIDAAVAAS